jgi:hypothetical protein
VGILQAILQVMLQGAGPVSYCPKVLKGVLLTERFVPGSSFLDIVLVACWAFCSWLLAFLFLDPRSVPGIGVRGHCWLLDIAGSWALRALGIAGS